MLCGKLSKAYYSLKALKEITDYDKLLPAYYAHFNYYVLKILKNLLEFSRKVIRAILVEDSSTI